ncbi:hypothetical protein N181_24785 [Sinorhizobium fredii USDA 205]|nr:hypothetical protein N181_24785 [Sinorhizobium fredii USDA 205]
MKGKDVVWSVVPPMLRTFKPPPRDTSAHSGGDCPLRTVRPSVFRKKELI